MVFQTCAYLFILDPCVFLYLLTKFHGVGFRSKSGSPCESGSGSLLLSRGGFCVCNTACLCICLKIRIFFRRWCIFIQINMPLYTKTACLSELRCASSREPKNPPKSASVLTGFLSGPRLVGYAILGYISRFFKR